jgi:hypothetical protein
MSHAEHTEPPPIDAAMAIPKSPSLDGLLRLWALLDPDDRGLVLQCATLLAAHQLPGTSQG